MNRDNINIVIKWRNFLAGALLLIFAAYYANVTLFSHYHVVDGVTIVHSHFHNSNHGNSSSPEHTRSEITLIQVLSNFVAEFQREFVYVAAIFVTAQFIYSSLVDHVIPINRYNHPQLRAPPVL